MEAYPRLECGRTLWSICRSSSQTVLQSSDILIVLVDSLMLRCKDYEINVTGDGVATVLGMVKSEVACPLARGRVNEASIPDDIELMDPRS